MTLLLTEIHCLDGLSHSCVIFAADRRISRSGKYDGTRKKVFRVPYLHAGVGFFGLAEISVQPSALSMSDWLSRFIQRNSNLTSLQAFAGALTKSLNADIASQLRQRCISGFHLAGYNAAGLPEFWYVRNVKDDRSTITGVYEEREDFLRRDAISLGYDGYNPHSMQTGVVQTYRNGDIRAHVTAWERIDEGFGTLLQERQFKKPRTIQDYEQWVKFKMEFISYFYKKYCRESLVARPIDTFSIERRNA
jgi:hypothetical protein